MLSFCILIDFLSILSIIDRRMLKCPMVIVYFLFLPLFLFLLGIFWNFQMFKILILSWWIDLFILGNILAMKSTLINTYSHFIFLLINVTWFISFVVLLLTYVFIFKMGFHALLKREGLHSNSLFVLYILWVLTTCIVTSTHHYNIIENSFIALKILFALPIHSSHSTPGNCWSYCLNSFALQSVI